MRISIIVPVRSDLKAFFELMDSIRQTIKIPEEIEIIAGFDNDDRVFAFCASALQQEYKGLNLEFHRRDRSEYFSRDYWNWLAKKATGRWIVNVALGCKFLTDGWDEIIRSKMGCHAEKFGDDLVHGLIKDNIPRHGEDPKFPHFSCHPVVSKKHIDILGYLFDERNWAWGCDQCVTILYKALNVILNQDRRVSLTDVAIFAEKDIHTMTQMDLDNIAKDLDILPTPQSTEFIIKVLRHQNKSYQKFLRISDQHPYSMSPEDALKEAHKLADHIRGKK